MLVLSRKKDQSIVLDGQIEVQVLKVKGNTVRLGIKAPSHVKVLRGELSPFNIDVEVERLEEPAGSSQTPRLPNDLDCGPGCAVAHAG